MRPSDRHRSVNFTKDERRLMLTLGQKYGHIIKRRNSFSLEKKRLVWNEIYTTFNETSTSGVHRSLESLKKLHLNMKNGWKKQSNADDEGELTGSSVDYNDESLSSDFDGKADMDYLDGDDERKDDYSLQVKDEFPTPPLECLLVEQSEGTVRIDDPAMDPLATRNTTQKPRMSYSNSFEATIQQRLSNPELTKRMRTDSPPPYSNNQRKPNSDVQQITITDLLKPSSESSGSIDKTKIPPDINSASEEEIKLETAKLNLAMLRRKRDNDVELHALELKRAKVEEEIRNQELENLRVEAQVRQAQLENVKLDADIRRKQLERLNS